jgi:membrane associated rhomboid family serine protease
MHDPPRRLHRLRTQISILASFVAVFWIVEILDVFLFRGHLDRFGIVPWNVIGLRGILFAPFLHGNFPHLIANTIPFVVLGWLVMVRRTADFWIVTLIVMGVAGLGTWLTGAPGSVHIGASGLIFGYLGYLLLGGYFDRSVGAIALSLMVAVFYGGLIWGVLPMQPGISWQGHLFGFLGGAWSAKLLADRRSRPKF